MKLETFGYLGSSGWSREVFPPLDSPGTLVVVFGAADFMDTPEPIRQLAAAYPHSHIIGCSTSGEIHGTSLRDGTLSVAVAQFEQTPLAATFARVSSAGDSFAAGQSLAREMGDRTLRGMLVLSDGSKVNGSELVRGINSVLQGSAVVTGGLAGDGTRFQRTWVIKDGRPESGYVSAVGFCGDRIRIGHGSKGGWDIFGPARQVTRSQGSVLYELDGKPALRLYKEYLGDLASGLPATALLFPLGLRASEEDTKDIVRTVLAVDEAGQSMTFAGDIPQGYRAQLMRANLDRLIDGASRAAMKARPPNHSTGPVLSIAISCVGRRLVLGERTEEELEASLSVLPEQTQQIGYYSYGEISPYADGPCDLHNQTMTLTTLSE